MDTEGINTIVTVDASGAVEGFQSAGEACQTYSDDVQTASGDVSASNDTMVESNGELVQSHQAVTTASAGSTASLKEGVLGASEAASGAIGLAFSVDELNQSQLTVDRAHKAVLTTTIALQKAQSDYTDAVNKFGADSPQAQTALEKLTAAQEGAKDASEKLDIAQSNQSQTELMMAVSIMPELITMISGISSAWEYLGPVLGYGAGAEDVAAESTDVLSDSFLGLDISMGVILIAIVAIAVAAYLIYTNWSTVTSFFSGVWSDVIGTFQWAWGVLSGIFDDISGAFSTAFSIIQTVVTDVMGVIMPIIQPFIDAVNDIGGVVNAISGAGSSIVSGVTSFFGGFADGGHVDATPGGATVKVAEAGEGEWMVPDSKMKAIVGGAALGSMPASMPTNVNSSSSMSNSSSVSIGQVNITGGNGQQMYQQFVAQLKQQGVKVT